MRVQDSSFHVTFHVSRQAGNYKESPGGESPELPAERAHANQQQLEFHLAVRGLRDVESDD